LLETPFDSLWYGSCNDWTNLDNLASQTMMDAQSHLVRRHHFANIIRMSVLRQG